VEIGGHLPGQDKDLKDGGKTVVASLVGGLFLIAAKLGLGIVGRSQALIADGIHSITDLFSDGMAYFGLIYGRKEADSNHPFGHGKIDTLMSMLIGTMMVMAGLWIIIGSIEDLVAGEGSIPNYLAVVGAIASIVIKEGLFQYSYLVGKRIRSQSIVANAWHHRSDAISSVAALLGILPALFNPDLYFFDIIAAMIVAALIIKLGVDIIVPAFKSASDIAPDNEKLDDISSLAKSIDGVIGVHDVRARYYADQLYVEMHVVVDGDLTVRQGHKIAVEVRRRLREDKDIVMDAIVHIDPHDDPHLTEKE
jgi:cation diffusion facilitator family transporter